MRKLLLLTILLFAAAVSVAGQTIAITNGKVYPVSGPPISNGTVVIRDGLIVAVGANVAIPPGAKRIDATGKVVTPGLIHSTTELGLIEIDQVRTTNDVTARGENNIAASFKVWTGLNPGSALFVPTRNEGVTTAAILPQGGMISGQAALIDLVTGSTDEMIRRAPVAMVGQIDNPAAAGTTARGELIAKLHALFEDVGYYMTHEADYDRAASRTLIARRTDLKALKPVLTGGMLLIIDANRMDEIDAAINLARLFHLKLAISGGSLAARRSPGGSPHSGFGRGHEQHPVELCDPEPATRERGFTSSCRRDGGVSD